MIVLNNIHTSEHNENSLLNLEIYYLDLQPLEMGGGTDGLRAVTWQMKPPEVNGFCFSVTREGKA